MSGALEVNALNMEATDSNSKKAEESVEDVPKILNPTLNDVFPVIVSMLDLKSFMNLAMTSKEMYAKCTDDRGAKPVVFGDCIGVHFDDGAIVPRCFCSFKGIQDSSSDLFFTSLRKLHCSVHLKNIGFDSVSSPAAVLATRRYLDELGVKNIKELEFENTTEAYEEVASFIEDFYIQDVVVEEGSMDLQRSLLQMNLSSFTSYCLNAEFLLEVDSPIREIYLTTYDYPRRIPKEIFLQLLWKIQTGSLKKLRVDDETVPYCGLLNVSFAHKGPLPTERPLHFSSSNFGDGKEEFFLHWTGDVTKCRYHGGYVSITKCDPADYPPILRSRDDVLDELKSQNNDRNICLLSDFHKLFVGYKSFDRSFKGPFPEERPLLYKSDDTSFWLLKEDGSWEHYKWDNGRMERKVWARADLCNECDDLILAKAIFREMLLQKGSSHSLKYNCFESYELFGDYKQLPFKYSRRLPKERPLVFEKEVRENEWDWENYDYHYYVLLKDGSVKECWFNHYNDDKLYMHDCDKWKVPTILISTETVREILLTYNDGGTSKFRVASDTFLGGFQGFKSFPVDYDGVLPEDLPVVFEKSEEDGVKRRWFVREDYVYEYAWKNGVTTVSDGFRDTFPMALKKDLTVRLLKGKENRRSYFGTVFFTIDLNSFRSCLEDFVRFPLNFSGPLPNDRPLLFENTEVKHVCQSANDCHCSEKIVQIWSLCEGEKMIFCSWKGEETQFKNLKYSYKDELTIIPALQTKEYLLFLLNSKWSVVYNRRFYWHGKEEDLISCFASKDIKRVKKSSEKRLLPQERPLLIWDTDFHWFLRPDDVLIRVHWLGSHAEVRIVHISKPQICTWMHKLSHFLDSDDNWSRCY